MSSSSASVMGCQRFLLLLFFLFNCVVLGDDSSDKSVLLEFKKSVSDPSGLLSTWTATSHHCSWSGVSCDRNSKVLSLNVTGHARRQEGNSDNTSASAYFSCSDYSLFPCYGFGIRKSCEGSNGSLFGTLLPSIGKLSELRILSLPFNRLSGEIPSKIWGLKKLEVLDLENNLLTGSWPASVSGLKNLRVLNMGVNNISGAIPSWLSRLQKLEILNLAFNPLNGSLPGFVGRFRGVYLSFSWLDGDLPADIGEGCKLEYLDLSGNFLGGPIPTSLGKCSQLRSLLLYTNLLEESIPGEIGQLQNLEVLDVSRNTLSGPIPAELGNCSGLTVLVLSNLFSPLDGLAMAKGDSGNFVNDDFNYYQGGIPDEITRLPKLRVLWAPRATLQGNLPSDWGACDNLEMVNLARNFFAGELPLGLSLCKKLRYLDLSLNKRLNGELFEELPVPCMTVFDVSGNSLSGSIPRFYNRRCPDVLTSDSYSSEPFNPTSAYLSYFASKTQMGKPFGFVGGGGGPTVFHNFGANNLTGSVLSTPLAPKRFGKQISYAFYAGENLMSGPFPGNLLEDCNRLDSLLVNVSYNRMSGQIPSEISICKSLRLLDVSLNQLSGQIPAAVGDSVSLVYLNVSWNLLEDQIPSSFKQMKDLMYLSLAGNNLTGPVLSSFRQLQSLEFLDLSSNLFSGEIPVDLVDLTNLTVLLLNNNNLSGQIPSGLVNMTMLSEFNASFNNLSGPIPPSKYLMNCSSLFGNPLLKPCHADSLIPSSYHTRPGYNSRGFAAPPSVSATQGAGKNAWNSFKIASTSFISTISLVIVIVIFSQYARKWNSKSKLVSTPKKEITIFKDIGVPLSFDDVLQATDNFDASNCIGSGGFGSTYKAEISPGVLVAIKRLAIGRPQGFEQFEAEISTLGKLQHKNLVTLIGYHSGESETFIIYNYLPGGNLQKFIQERSIREVNWSILHKIALDVARALNYLHEQCVPRVLHRDVKPSNILLDDDYNAYLSDFGLAKLMGNSRSHVTTGVAGTFGYVAPEYVTNFHVSEKSDVYSYGVVLLELLADKRALDPSFSAYGDSFNIVKWSSLLVKQGRAEDFFAEGLWNAGSQKELEEVLHLAVVCTLDLHLRPTMKQVVDRLEQIRPQKPA